MKSIKKIIHPGIPEEVESINDAERMQTEKLSPNETFRKFLKIDHERTREKNRS